MLDCYIVYLILVTKQVLVQQLNQIIKKCLNCQILKQLIQIILKQIIEINRLWQMLYFGYLIFLIINILNKQNNHKHIITINIKQIYLQTKHDHVAFIFKFIISLIIIHIPIQKNIQNKPIQNSAESKRFLLQLFMKTQQKQNLIKSKEAASFHQILQGVENLVNDEEEQFFANTIPDSLNPLSKSDPALTNREKLKLIMNNQQYRKYTTDLLKELGYLEGFPILKVWLKLQKEDQQIDFNDEDLEKVFLRFGYLEKVLIKQNATYIFFSDYHSAFFAQRSLNNLQIYSVQARLMVDWCKPNEYLFIKSFMNLDSLRSNDKRSNPINNNLNQAKYTSRYEIQIQNQKQFQVARRIIGPRGLHMKRIIDTSLNHIGADPKNQNDAIKLRLRGKGSGYREGNLKQQSQQPLHLCISCKEEGAFLKVCGLVQQLLLNIYEEYKQYCIKIGRLQENFQIKKLSSNINQINEAKTLSDNIQTISNEYGHPPIHQSQIRAFIEARNKARRQLNFLEADRIRNYLKSIGILLMDEKGGRGRGIEVTTWRFNNI